jgi:hypothetical protein
LVIGQVLFTQVPRDAFRWCGIGNEGLVIMVWLVVVEVFNLLAMPTEVKPNNIEWIAVR